MTPDLDAIRQRGGEPMSERDRLYGKYRVARLDNRDLPSGDKANARYFVLDYANDECARIALAVYANACEANQPGLAADLRAQLADVGGLPDEAATR